MRRLGWKGPTRPLPPHPIRDSAVLYAFMAVVIVIVATATGGALGRAIIAAGAFFVAAMVWTVLRWRQRLRREGE